MRLGRDVNHMRDSMIAHNSHNRRLIVQIDSLEHVFWMTFDVAQVRKLPGIRQAIEVHQPLNVGPFDSLPHKVRADEPSAACDQ
jgi:hypothetical protein